jgi:hypothetical protein
MTRTRPPADLPPTPPDPELGSLVRAVADDWRMPPQRLDQPTWRDRVGRETQGGHRRRWVARVAVPATAAIAATVVVALAAVWLNGPVGPNTGKIVPTTGPDTSSSPSASPTDAAPSKAPPSPTASELPQLFLAGPAPDPSRLLVRNGSSTSVADLTTGTLTSSGLSPHSGAATVVPDGKGGWICVCIDWQMPGDFATGVDIHLERGNQDGSPGPGATIRSVEGSRDPGVGGASQLDLADARATVSPDGRTVFVGWAVHVGGTGWSAGIDLVDVATGAIDQRFRVPVEATSAAKDTGVSFGAPTVSASPSGKTLLVSVFWYSRSNLGFGGTYRWTAPFSGTTIGPLQASRETSAAVCPEVTSGMIDDAASYLVCSSAGFRFERFGLDGRELGRTDVPMTDARTDGLTQAARAGRNLFLWEASTGRLSRIDLLTGEVAHGSSVASMRGVDPLSNLARALGRWLAPVALAKVFVEPGVVVSPDGRTVYAIGIHTVTGEDDGGSLGVFVFDADTLTQKDHWAPVADYVSMALSADGRFVYVLGRAGVDATGNYRADQETSVTVYDAATGSVRAIAGRLGNDLTLFPGPIVR